MVQFSVIIVNFRSWVHLEPCLQSLIQIKNLNFETIVVDNNSADGELARFITDFPTIKFIASDHNLGFGAGCHLGTLHAQSNVFLFLNPDTIANEAALLAMHQLLTLQNNVGIVSCRQHQNIKKHHLLFPSFIRLFGVLRSIDNIVKKDKFKEEQYQNHQFIAPHWVSASVLMIKKSVYEATGGYSKKLWMYYEDPDLCYKVHKLGYKIQLLTNQMIYHKHGGATRINIPTAVLTKTEVTISRHVYINEHFDSFSKLLSHSSLILILIFIELPIALILSFLLFVPKIKVHVFVIFERIKYLLKVLKTGSWLSERLVS